ncbi:MAG: hypothetical protein WBF05_13205 [Anaerolineales bacterium]
MTPPRLTFFCELEVDPLEELINEETIQDIKDLNGSVALGIMDFSPRRAGVVRRLNQAGIPAIGWLLLPKEQGYWFNLKNYTLVHDNYSAFKDWTEANGLLWARVGLDIEPDILELEQLFESKRQLLQNMIRRLFSRTQLKDAKMHYQDLVAQIKADGYLVESYQFPIIADERKARSTFIQRTSGVVDIAVDKEVWMIYTSFIRPYGAGVLGSYAPEAQAIGIGSTGGGVDIGLVDMRPLDWDELSRDLRLAWYWCEDLYIFSLEGCIRQRFMGHLKEFQWDYPILLPEDQIRRVNGWRGTIRSVLWLFAHPLVPLLTVFGVYALYKGVQRVLKE